MSKLYFKFGPMGSSKTANALMTAYNYQEKGYSVWLIKPAIDTRDDEVDANGNRITKVRSRIGLSSVAHVIDESDSILEKLKTQTDKEKVNVIICDECQFLTELQVDELRYITAYYDIPVLCFGLRSDFQAKLFTGSKRLFEVADSIAEIKSVCKCGAKAIINARLDEDGNVVTVGDQVEIGGNDKYEAMCWKCWKAETK